jgi:hypothetical protein
MVWRRPRSGVGHMGGMRRPWRRRRARPSDDATSLLEVSFSVAEVAVQLGLLAGLAPRLGRGLQTFDLPHTTGKDKSVEPFGWDRKAGGQEDAPVITRRNESGSKAGRRR